MGNLNNKLQIVSYCKKYKPNNRNIYSFPIGFLKYMANGDIARIKTFEMNKSRLELDQLDRTDYFFKERVYERIQQELGLDMTIYSKKSLDLANVEVDYKTPHPLKLFVYCDLCNKGFIYNESGCSMCYESNCVKCDTNSKACLYCGIISHRVQTVYVPDIKEVISSVIKNDEDIDFPWATSWMNSINIIPSKVMKKLDISDDELTELYPHLYAILIKDRDVCLLYLGDNYDVEPVMSIMRSGNGICVVDHDIFHHLKN